MPRFENIPVEVGSYRWAKTKSWLWKFFVFPNLWVKSQIRENSKQRSRWDSNPQSPAPEASALSIRPRDRIMTLLTYLIILNTKSMINYRMYFVLFLACIGRKLNAKLQVIKGHMNFDFFSYTLKKLKEISEILYERIFIALWIEKI